MARVSLYVGNPEARVTPVQFHGPNFRGMTTD